MAYDWRPTASRSVTTEEHAVARPSPAVTTAAVIEEFIERVEQGHALNRSGRRYRPSALRDLSGILRYHVAPALGERPLREVRRADVQSMVDGIAGEGLSESRIRSVISALRALYGYAIEQGYVEFNPADGLVMPRAEDAPRSKQESHREIPPSWEDDGRWGDTGSWQQPPKRRESRGRRDRGRDQDQDGDGYQPMAVMPERILTLALRAVFALFIIVALISLLEPA